MDHRGAQARPIAAILLVELPQGVGEKRQRIRRPHLLHDPAGEARLQRDAEAVGRLLDHLSKRPERSERDMVQPHLLAAERFLQARHKLRTDGGDHNETARALAK